jgi:myosin heavy subunit
MDLWFGILLFSATIKNVVGREATVITEDGTQLTRPLSALVRLDEATVTVDDMVSLNELNEPTLLHNIRTRFHEVRNQ